jgi:hypothetical protein
MEPNAQPAPANEPAAPVSNEPAAPAAPPAEPAAPATPAPAGDNNQPASPAKGNNLDTIDVDHILSEAEKQANAAGGGEEPKPGEPGAPAPGEGEPAAPAAPAAGEGEPAKPAEPAADPNKPAEPAKPADVLPEWNTITPQTTDLAAVEVDDKYGIQPISEFPEPAEGQSWNDYVKAELMPRMVQAVTNLAGLRQKSFDAGQQQQTQAQEQAQQERADSWVSTIDDLVKSKAIPGYTLDKDGKLDINSEGGKVVAGVFQKMNELNKDRPENQRIYDFGVVHQLWKAEQAEKAASEAAQKGANTRREQSRRIAGATQNNSSKPTPGAGVRKGMTLDDIEIE